MRRNFLLGVFMVMALVLIPCNVYALPTVEEAKVILDTISNEKNNDGDYVLKLNSLEPKYLVPEGKCEYTKEELIATCEEGGSGCYYESISDEEWPDTLKEMTNSCYNDHVYPVLSSYFKKIGLNYPKDFGFDYYNGDLTVYVITDEENFSQETRKYKVEFVGTKDNSLYDKARQYADSFKKEYIIYSLRVINSVYHYGGIEENIYNNDLVLYRFPEVKELMESNKEFDTSLTLGGAGGTPFITGNQGYITVSKDGVLLALKDVHFTMNHTLFVDKAEKGTIYEKAEKRIADYFEGSVSVDVDSSENTVSIFEDEADNDWFSREMKTLFGIDDENLKGYFTKVKINDKTQDILIVEVDKKLLDKVEIFAKDYDTDVNINTESYDVPLDVIVDADDVSDEDYVNKAGKDGKIEFKHVYDINLIGKGNGKHIKNVKNGVEVCIPIEGYKVGDKVTVYYISEDGKVEEEYAAEVVKIDNKLYAKFVTKHFSTYGVAGKTNNVPDTGDMIYYYIALVIVSLSGVLYLTKKLN